MNLGGTIDISFPCFLSPDPQILQLLNNVNSLYPGSNHCHLTPGLLQEPQNQFLTATEIPSLLWGHHDFIVIVVKYNQHEMYPFNHFRGYNSQVLSTFTVLCSNHFCTSYSALIFRDTNYKYVGFSITCPSYTSFSSQSLSSLCPFLTVFTQLGGGTPASTCQLIFLCFLSMFAQL